MANPDWGTKHFCQGCGAKYYDLNRSPVVCPKCGAAHNPEALLRSRRSRPASPAREPVKKPVKKPVKEAAAVPAAAPAPSPGDGDEKLEKIDGDLAAVKDDDDVETAVLAKTDDDDKLIEDTSDLGADDDDVAEVVVSGDEKEDT